MIHNKSISAAIIFRYFGNLSSRQQEQFEQIGPIYASWNKKLNLISRKDIDYINLKHVLHALSIAKVVTFEPGTQVLDVGTGGGFPGIPLAIMFPQTQFHLIDSIGKKINTVQKIAEALELANLSTKQARAENIGEQYDFILGRAVSELSIFHSWVKNNIALYSQNTIPNGILYLQGEASITLPVPYTTYAIRDFFDDPFFETKQLVHLMRSAHSTQCTP